MRNRLNIQLPHALDRFVRSKVTEGRYISASDVVRDALRLMEDRDLILANYKDQVWKRIAQGLEALSDAVGKEQEPLLDNIEAQLDQMEATLRAVSAGVEQPEPLAREHLALLFEDGSDLAGDDLAKDDPAEDDRVEEDDLTSGFLLPPAGNIGGETPAA